MSGTGVVDSIEDRSAPACGERWEEPYRFLSKGDVIGAPQSWVDRRREFGKVCGTTDAFETELLDCDFTAFGRSKPNPEAEKRPPRMLIRVLGGGMASYQVVREVHYGITSCSQV